ncbi:hypothetical protein BDZ89DRAFT_1041724 [Hymenopellis radicata]|nr:hypothetical protein BDZ89DRAFT_1041724 [Hymenopellis radicata]
MPAWGRDDDAGTGTSITMSTTPLRGQDDTNTRTSLTTTTETRPMLDSVSMFGHYDEDSDLNHDEDSDEDYNNKNSDEDYDEDSDEDYDESTTMANLITTTRTATTMKDEDGINNERQ